MRELRGTDADVFLVELRTKLGLPKTMVDEHVMLNQAHFHRNMQGCLQAAERLIADHNCGHAYAVVADLYIRNSKAKKALAWMQQSLADKPERIDVLPTLAYTAALVGDRQLADRYADRAVEHLRAGKDKMVYLRHLDRALGVLGRDAEKKELTASYFP